jgi:glucose-6-phosphate isomerase
MPINITIHPGTLDKQFNQQIRRLDDQHVLKRLWDHDHTLWDPSPEEITNRLDWLGLHESMLPQIEEISNFSQEVIDQGFKTIVLLGMGGSSLAPEVFSKIFGTGIGFPALMVLDTTDPVAIRNAQEQIELSTSLFIVATKSGGTVETLSLFKYFYTQVSDLSHIDPGNHFVAITDPGSKLEQLAKDLGFRKTFLNNPNLGGRYSALSMFGLVPAALIGCDLEQLLGSAARSARANSSTTPLANAPAAQISALIAAGEAIGRDKLTFLSDTSVSSFSDWVEQLIAESTGKSGKGILPVVGEPVPVDLSNYSQDRIFALQKKAGGNSSTFLLEDLISLGFPVIETRLGNEYDLGELILTWEIATSLIGHLIGIHPFNQPDVESAKVSARESVQAYQDQGKLPDRETSVLSTEVLTTFLSVIQPGDYISLQAYLPHTHETEQVFRRMQAKLRDQYQVAVTLGFGPRFLHSTGQLHKGDRGNGHFIQFVSKATADIDIPEKAGENRSLISFDTLKHAQAIGDGIALKSKHRPLLGFNLPDIFLPELETFVDVI